MLIKKTEDDDELLSRQLAYFRATNALKISSTFCEGYEYEYVPGQMCQNVNDVLVYLFDNVWPKPSLGIADADHYANYIGALCDTNEIILPRAVHSMISDLADQPECLVHGDATMENMLQTSDGIIGIDPGLPRGFCSRENDVGKILQSVLTQWEWVRHGQPVAWLGNRGKLNEIHVFDDGDIGITKNSLVSLLTHWIRIVKNRHRHPPHVEHYARNVVIPQLCTELVSSKDYNFPYRWSGGRLAALRNYFMNIASDYARHTVAQQ